jgi:MFS family permease
MRNEERSLPGVQHSAFSIPHSSPPSRVRYGVLWLACSLSMITYLDRVFMGASASHFIRDLGLRSEAELGWVYAAFTLAYALFEVPSGWLGDVFGPRSVLVRIVLWWSVFTALTGLVGLFAWGGWSFSLPWAWAGPLRITVTWVTVLVVLRFLFGMGEAGGYPNITRALHNWFPRRDRGFAQGTVWMCGRLMGGLTPIVWLVLVEGVSVISLPPLLGWTGRLGVAPWRASFLFAAVVGVVWCLFFLAWFRNRPEEKPSVNAGELALIRADRDDMASGHARVPWRRILASRNLWFLGLMYFCQTYGWSFFITYMHRFMETQYDSKPSDLLGAVYKGGPLWMGAIGCLIGGLLTDAYVRRTGNRRWGRRLIGMVGHGLAALCFALCPLAPTALWFFLAISLSAFFMDLTMGASWACCQDVGRRYAAVVAGFMNMIGNLGGAVVNLVTGQMLDRAQAGYAARLGRKLADLSPEQLSAALRPAYQVAFLSFAAALLLGVVCWSQIDATRPVVPDELPNP